MAFDGQTETYWGIYSYSTASSSTAAGACEGAGLPPQAISDVIGIVKGYPTAVGGGPFPTELFDKDGERLDKSAMNTGQQRNAHAVVDGSTQSLYVMERYSTDLLAWQSRNSTCWIHLRRSRSAQRERKRAGEGDREEST
jgi:hypothetical protein